MEIGTNTPLPAAQTGAAKSARSEEFAPLSFRRLAASAIDLATGETQSVDAAKPAACAARPGAQINIVV